MSNGPPFDPAATSIAPELLVARAALRLTRDGERVPPTIGPRLWCPDAIAHFMSRVVREAVVEHVWVLALNESGAVILGEPIVVARGSVNAVHGLTAATIFRPLIVLGAARCVLVHNHVNTLEVTPSDADDMTTVLLVRLGEPLGFRVDDHLVISSDEPTRFYSYAAQGRAPFPPHISLTFDTSGALPSALPGAEEMTRTLDHLLREIPASAKKAGPVIVPPSSIDGGGTEDP